MRWGVLRSKRVLSAINAAVAAVRVYGGAFMCSELLSTLRSGGDTLSFPFLSLLSFDVFQFRIDSIASLCFHLMTSLIESRYARLPLKVMSVRVWMSVLTHAS